MSLQEFAVPQIGGLGDVEIVEWHVKVGDHVSEHQTLASVETDKSVIELPSPFTGVVRKLGGDPGDRLVAGAVLAVVETDATAPVSSSATAPAAEPATDPRQIRRESVAGSGVEGRDRARAAPTVRRLARELGVELSDVAPTGTGGLVTADDVRAAAAGTQVPAAASASTTGREPVRTRLSGLRRATARNMTAVARVPHITSHREVEVSALIRWRGHVNERREGSPLTFTPFLAMCVIAALRAVPRLNATFDEDAEELSQHAAVHLGVATATDDGLLVPVVHDADLKTIEELSAAIDDLSAAARKRTLRPEQMTGGTFTITNYGARAGWFATPLLRLPEIGIAGFGRIAERPWVTDGSVVVGNILPVSISVDHRLIDGDVAGQFGEALAGFLHDPLRFL